MADAQLVTESRDALARALCDYWDSDDEATRARLGYPCIPCLLEADYLIECGVVRALGQS